MSNSPTRPTPNSHIPEHLPADVKWGFTCHGLNQLRHHCHWIAVGRGFTQAFLDRHWPGLKLGDAMALAKQAGVWKRDRQHFTNLAVAKRVKEFHILHDGSTRVVKFTNAELNATATKPS